MAKNLKTFCWNMGRLSKKNRIPLGSKIWGMRPRGLASSLLPTKCLITSWSKRTWNQVASKATSLTHCIKMLSEDRNARTRSTPTVLRLTVLSSQILRKPSFIIWKCPLWEVAVLEEPMSKFSTDFHAWTQAMTGQSCAKISQALWTTTCVIPKLANNTFNQKLVELLEAEPSHPTTFLPETTSTSRPWNPEKEKVPPKDRHKRLQKMSEIYPIPEILRTTSSRKTRSTTSEKSLTSWIQITMEKYQHIELTLHHWSQTFCRFWALFS